MPKGVFKRRQGLKRKPMSDETKRKIGLANSIRKHHPQEGFQKGNSVNTSRKFSEEHKRKIRENPRPQWFKKGFSSWNKGTKGLSPSGENHSYWKGKDAGYRAKHCWMDNHFGKPDKCEHCEQSELTGHQIHWANISGEYKRERSDWLRLCVKCHGEYDKKH